MKHYSLGNVVRSGAWGLLVGGAVGFTLGILLAPEEGDKVRRRIAYQLEHLTRQVGSLLEQVVSPGVTSEARRTGDALVADAEVKARRIRDDIDALLGELQRQGTNN
ncbi:MAG: YtxH domain-containing protein [Bacteroidetes bacterium]|nr:MAG: YtxH domain-containing protein [Bacteroidota bacterium]